MSIAELTLASLPLVQSHRRQDSRSTAALSNADQENPAATTQEVPQTFAQLRNLLFDEKNQPKPGYSKGISWLSTSLNSLGFLSGKNSFSDNTSVNSFLSCLVQPGAYDGCADLLKDKLISEQEGKNNRSRAQKIIKAGLFLIRERHQIESNTEALLILKLSVQLVDDNRGRFIANYLNQGREAVARGSVSRETQQLSNGDSIDFIAASNVDPNKAMIAKNEFIRVWCMFREDAKPRKCTVLFTQTNGAARSCATMEQNPNVIVDLDHQDYRAVAFHEAVHAVFGESGCPGPDIAEGYSTAITDLFHEGTGNKPSPNMVAKLRAILDGQRMIPSSTGFLRMADTQGIKIDEYEKESMKYSFSYYFFKALLDSPAYQRVAELWKSRNLDHGSYGFLHEINRVFSQYYQEYSSRNLPTGTLSMTMGDSLRHLNFQEAEILGIFDDIRRRVQ